MNAFEKPEIIRRHEGVNRRRFLFRWGVLAAYGCIWAFILIFFAVIHANRNREFEDLYTILNVKPSSYSLDLNRFISLLLLMAAIIAVFLIHGSILGRKVIRGLAPLKSWPLSERASANRFRSAIESVSIATGRAPLDCRILPSSMPNALGFIIKGKPYMVVTSGLLDSDLTQREMNSIVAHEYAHIIIGDALWWRSTFRLYFSLIVCYFLTLCLIFLILPWIRSWEISGFQAVLIVLMPLIAALPFPVFAFLKWRSTGQDDIFADAVAVMITRDPDALISSISKIAISEGSIDFNRFEMISILGATNGPLSIRMSMARYFFVNPLRFKAVEQPEREAEIERYFPLKEREEFSPYEKKLAASRLERHYLREEALLQERLSALERIKQGVYESHNMEAINRNIIPASEWE